MWERNESFFGVASPSSSKTKFVSFVSFPRYTEPIINSLLSFSSHIICNNLFYLIFSSSSFFFLFFSEQNLAKGMMMVEYEVEYESILTLSSFKLKFQSVFSLQLVLLLLADRSIKGGDFFYFVLRQRWFQAVISSPSQVSLASHFAV